MKAEENQIEKFAEDLSEQIRSGASISDVIDLLHKQFQQPNEVTDEEIEEEADEILKELNDGIVKKSARRGIVAGMKLMRSRQPKPIDLPNNYDLNLLARLLKYCNKYDISIQFWIDQTAVYIQKNNVDLTDFGGDFEFAVTQAIDYLERINKKQH